ncbi:MAG: hypothetical protein PHO08_06935 [Methylococcales bacterium]|nr:hypothetical protein [Methylococcales bacterium]MDD5631104.1 hypothetical protein [Methylococcales bacterium]
MAANSGFADQSITKTYRRLRYLVSVALIALPILTAVSAFLLGRHELQPSLSDYYFVVRDGGLPRTIFLIFLAFLGCVLFAYRGLDEWDNLIHNAAGVFSFLIALFPMHCDLTEHPYCVPGLFPFLHLPSAGLLFLFAVISVWYGGGPKLKEALSKLPEPKGWFLRLSKIKYWSATLMTIGIVSFFVHALQPEFMSGFSWIFWIEYAGFFGFGLYWWRLMLLVNDANKSGQQMKSQVERLEPYSIVPGSERRAPKTELWEDIP